MLDSATMNSNFDAVNQFEWASLILDTSCAGIVFGVNRRPLGCLFLQYNEVWHSGGH